MGSLRSFLRREYSITVVRSSALSRSNLVLVWCELPGDLSYR